MLTGRRARAAGADGGLDALAELPGRLDVVGQDEDLLGEHRGFAALRSAEQPAHALDDDARLAGARAGDDDERPVAPLDDPPLLGRQRRRRARLL